MGGPPPLLLPVSRVRIILMPETQAFQAIDLICEHSGKFSIASDARDTASVSPYPTNWQQKGE